MSEALRDGRSYGQRRSPVSSSRGRGWAYTGAVLGGIVSVAANVAHSYVPPSNAPAGWVPEPGAVAAAVFWPVALLVGVEILARSAWPDATRWTIVRYAGLLPVALVAAVVSYRHLSGLLEFYGEDPLTATVGPLAVDGLMIMATAALIATAPATAETVDVDSRTPPASAAAPSPVAAEPISSNGDTPKARHRPAKTAPGATQSTTSPADVTELVPLGREIAARLAAEGKPLTRRVLCEQVRLTGRSLSNARAGQLLKLLRADDHTPEPEPDHELKEPVEVNQ